MSFVSLILLMKSEVSFIYMKAMSWHVAEESDQHFFLEILLVRHSKKLTTGLPGTLGLWTLGKIGN